MTTEEAMLIPIRASHLGMSVTSERKWNDDSHTISITGKKASELVYPQAQSF